MLKPYPPKPREKPCAVEITTLYSLRGLKKKFIGKYIVIASSPSAAVEGLNEFLRAGEEVLEAKEMKHELVMIYEKN